MYRGGGRPAVIISNDIGNNAGPVLEIVYLTTQEKKPLPTHVKINSSKYPSTVLCEQIDTVNKDKVGDYIGQCSMAEMKRIDAALAVSIGIGTNIKGNELVKKWAEAANETVKPDEKKPEPITEKVEIFFSCREAERQYDLPPNSVGKVCRGELESIYGYRFGYL